MAKLFLFLTFLLLIHGCLADREQFQENYECQIQRIDVLEPNQRFQSEAGFTEFYDFNDQQFRCAGVEVVRHQIQPKGLLLPSYTTAPILFYVEHGNGIHGVMLPGCPDQTHEVSQQLEGGSSFQDRHQKIHHFRQGDMVAIPTGAAHWIYNDGKDDIVIVALLDVSNAANQLDQIHRRFFLTGSSQQQQQQQGESQEHGSNNIFKGFSVELLAEAFNVDQQTAEMLQSKNDQRGHIVMVENDQRGLQFIRSSISHVENGLEETICSMKLQEDIDDASKADIYNPLAGRCTNLNSFKFPVLKMLQLSAEAGVLYSNGMVSPHWIMNAHTIIYVTYGNMRVQIVNNQGQQVFNDQIREQQLIVVPQNFAVIKKAGPQGCKWISFRTNDNAMINTLAGMKSAMSALPLDVIANSYDISRDDAKIIKYSRQEYQLLTPLNIAGL